MIAAPLCNGAHLVLSLCPPSQQAMKEPARAQAKLRETVYFKSSPWKDGKPEKTGRLLRILLAAAECAVHLLAHSLYPPPI